VTFVRDFIVTAGSNFGIALFGAVGGILAARVLGPEGRGELAAAVVWAGILAGIAQLGLPQALIYFMAREPDTIGSVFSTAMVLCLTQSVGILLVGWFVVGLLAQSQPVVDAIRIYLFSIPCSLLTAYLSAISQGLKRFDLLNILRIAAAAVSPLTMILAIVLGIHEAGEVVILLLGAQILLGVVALVWFFVKTLPVGKFEWRRARQLLGYGFRSYWGNLSWMANARFDQFVMSAFTELDELGHYAVAVSYATMLFPLSSAFAMVMFPRVAESEQRTARSMIGLVLKLNLIISSIGALVLAFLAPVILPWVFGIEFIPSVYPGIALLGGTVLLGCNYVLSDGLRGLGAPLAVSAAETVGAVITVGGLMIFLPKMGIRGAAWVSVFSYATVFLVLFIWFKRRYRATLSVKSGVVVHDSEPNR
jgi:O-antigen/teichoic acid export membrane protein